jgi:VanZ family protein
MNKPLTVSSQLLWTIATIIFLCILATILWFAYRGALPPVLTQNDKLAHFVLYGMATFLGHRAFNRRHLRPRGCSIPLFPALFLLFTLGEELVQHFSPNRTLDLWDSIASTIGIGVGYGLAQYRRRQPN